MKKNVYAENCPADKIREYIEEIIRLQKGFILSGEAVPEEFLIPSRIELSPENISFLLNSKLVDFIGAGKTGSEINFYWKQTGPDELPNLVDGYPALEVRVRLEEDGKYYLTYIREEASNEKAAFEWDVENQNNKAGTLTVSKRTDALEDIVDMDEDTNHPKIMQINSKK